MTLRNIILERRESTRKVPDQFAFLQLEQDDGGKILDISEGGLRFESFAAVQEHNPVHFWFSLNLRERIEGSGELAWTDAKAKSGGLKFLSLSEKGREQIREYLGRSSFQRDPARAGTGDPGAVAKSVRRPRAERSSILFPKRESGDAGIPFPIHAPAAAPAHLVPLQRHLAALRRQLVIGVMIGASAAGVVTLAAVKFSQYLHENRTAAKLPVEIPMPTPPEARPTVAAPPVATGIAGDVFAIAQQKSEGVAAGASAALPSHPVAPSTLPKKRLSPDQLWTLVQSGNSAAAAALAELYIKGDGVPQSCAQARVLLLVASEKRNAAAIKRLAEMDKQGCPAN